MVLSLWICESHVSAMSKMKPVSIVPPNGTNYPTWKLQCRMKDSLWGIVNGSEAAPGLATDADRALALKWRAVTIGDPEDPVEVWRKLSHTENLGQQARTLTEALHFRVKRWRVCSAAYQRNDRNI